MLKPRRPHFLDVFSSTSSANSLKIPVGFRRNLEGKFSGSVLLKGPSGYSWVVELFQKNDDLFFDKGWADFVGDHCLGCGDFLVFRYDGELVFDVKVFDQSKCEKEVAFHCKCIQGGNEFNGIVGQKRYREDGGVSLDQDCEELLKRITESSFQSDGDKEHCGDELVLATKSCQGLTSYDENHDETILRTGKEDDLNLHGSCCIQIVGEFEERKVAQSFNSRFPFFVRIMKRFNVSGSYTLNIPYQFAMEHLPKCKTKIVLRNLKGSCWPVNSVPTTRVHTNHTLCGGWLSFVRSNEIKVGDICIFEFVCKFEFHVHILRVGKEDLDRQSGVAVANVLIDSSDSTLLKDLVKNASKVHSKLEKVQMCDNKGSKILNKKKYGKAAKRSASVVLCSLSRSCNERQASKTKAAVGGSRTMLAIDEEKASSSFASGFPNFVRIMKKFNVNGSYTPKIPYKFSKAHLPYCKTQVVLRNLQGKCWTVNSLPDSKGRTVHTFCGGWMAFVRDNDIKMGDICVFELVNFCEMLVHISGPGRKVLD